MRGKDRFQKRKTFVEATKTLIHNLFHKKEVATQPLKTESSTVTLLRGETEKLAPGGSQTSQTELIQSSQETESSTCSVSNEMDGAVLAAPQTEKGQDRPLCSSDRSEEDSIIQRELNEIAKKPKTEIPFNRSYSREIPETKSPCTKLTKSRREKKDPHFPDPIKPKVIRPQTQESPDNSITTDTITAAAAAPDTTIPPLAIGNAAHWTKLTQKEQPALNPHYNFNSFTVTDLSSLEKPWAYLRPDEKFKDNPLATTYGGRKF